jgi:hypothetical protein
MKNHPDYEPVVEETQAEEPVKKAPRAKKPAEE